MSPIWGLRVATTPGAGAGHLTRCRALARQLAAAPILFSDPWKGSDRPNWNGKAVPERSDSSVDEAVAALASGKIAGLIVDSYVVEENAIAAAAAAGFTAVFRDGALPQAETVSINPNPGYTSSEHVLGGPSYMPLSSDFVSRHARALATPRVSGAISAVLVSFGARDSADRTSDVLRGLALLARPPQVTVVMGGRASHRGTVRTAIELWPWARLRDSAELGDLYSEFDVAFGAPGVSQFERACCGLPTVLVAQNAYQVGLVETWVESGAAASSSAEAGPIAALFDKLVDSPDTLRRMRAKGLSLVDGAGASRLAEELARRRARHIQ